MLLLKDLFGPYSGLNPGVVGLADCESFFTRLDTEWGDRGSVCGPAVFEHPLVIGAGVAGQFFLIS